MFVRKSSQNVLKNQLCLAGERGGEGGRGREGERERGREGGEGERERGGERERESVILNIYNI